ncbi:glycosylation-dependent cell adhesion molecule 1-like [Lemur catta]|uniref:glycosylation-dependent cell adhesion molecule 1-like n=1 Tax=Lemur catta TaxID=9447 RepID=UPI001E266767|nr:glycosylation-dependent cell adhesion molecule 1-like [Lemur catta]
MTFFTVLLLASLASTSLAVLNEPEDEIHWETQPTDAQKSQAGIPQNAQFTASSHPGMDHVSNEDFSKESFNSQEELISKENVVIKSAGQKSQNPELLHPMPQEDSFRNAELQSEETAELTPMAAITSEGKLPKFGQKIGKYLDKAAKEITNSLQSLIPSANDVMRP